MGYVKHEEGNRGQMIAPLTDSRFRRAMRVLDHAIDSLGPSKPCMLLVEEGHMYNVPSTNSNADRARAVLVDAMLRLVRERNGE